MGAQQQITEISLREMEERLNLYGWGRWAMVNYERLMGARSILGQVAAASGYREESKHPVPPITDAHAMKVDRIIARQPIAGSAIMLLRYGRQMTYRRIGEVLKMPHTTVALRIDALVDDVYLDFTSS